MKKLAIIGASGHGKVVADIAEKNGYSDIIFLDDYSTGECAGYPIVGTSKSIEKLSGFDFIVAIGDNKTRERLLSSLPINKVVTLIHPKATISRRVSICEGAVIMAGAIVNSDVSIGKGVIVNTGTTVDHDCQIGDFVHLSPGCHIAGNVSIGHGSWIGIGSSIIQSLSICEEVIVGAGGVVIKSIDSSGTYVGHPCRKVY
ncbi:TPA: acetyltransferase [Streptococcus suis]